MSLKKNIRDPGFIVFYLFILAGTYRLMTYTKGELLLKINDLHNPFLDLFFKYWTHLGDGTVFAVLMIFFLLTNYYRSIILFTAIITQTLVVQGMKYFVFADAVRPKLFLENFDGLHQVAGVEIHSFHSFPSGHTATAFTIGVLLALIIRKPHITAMLMVMAILVGISRIYLLQHFFIDVYFGALIGFLNGLLVFTWLESTGLKDQNRLNRGLLNR